MDSNVWQAIGKDAYSRKVEGGFIHVMKIGARMWSVALNGRVIGSAATGAEALKIGESA